MTTSTARATRAAATTSAPDPFQPPGRLDAEAARARCADLFVAHRRMVEGLCRGLLRDAAEAEDAAQQAFLSAYRALVGGTEPREPAAWLATIARNECLARIRARMREPLPVEQVRLEGSAADPLSESLRRADLAALWAAITALPRQQREALLLREFGGLAYEELAVALGVTGPAVESLLFRARTRLRGQLEAAYASLGGVGWISALQDAVARLVSTGGAAKIGSIPLVAKAVTAGVGIAVVAGGTVVGEHGGGHARRAAARPALAAAAAGAPPASPRAVAAVRPAQPAPAAERIRLVLPTPRGPAPAAPAPSGGDGENDPAHAQDAHRPGDGRAASGGHEQDHGSGGERTQTTSADAGILQSDSSPRHADSSSGGGDEQGGSDGGDGGGSSPESSSSGDSGSSGDSHGAEPGDTVATVTTEVASHDGGVLAVGD